MMAPWTTENTELAIACVLTLWLVFVFSPLRWTLRRVIWLHFLPRDTEIRDRLLAIRARAAFTAGRRGLAHELCSRHSVGKWVFNGLVRDAMPEIVPELRTVKRAAADELRLQATTALNEGDRARYQELWKQAHELEATTVGQWQEWLARQPGSNN